MAASHAKRVLIRDFLERSVLAIVANNSWQTWFSLPSPCAPWTPSACRTFEVTQTRSLVITPAHTSMFQVLTGTRSSRVHRMWPDLNISSSERNRARQDAAPHRPRAVCTVQGCEHIAAAIKTAAFAYSFVLPRLPDAGGGGVWAVLVARERLISRPAAHVGRA